MCVCVCVYIYKLHLHDFVVENVQRQKLVILHGHCTISELLRLVNFCEKEKKLKYVCTFSQIIPSVVSLSKKVSKYFSKDFSRL